MKDHSGLCRKRAELTKDIKVIDNRISDTVFKAVLRSKELHTKLVLHSKKQTKLQQQSNYETNPPTPGFPRSVYNFGVPDAQSDSTFSTVDTPVYAIRKQNTENLSQYMNRPQTTNFALNLNTLEPPENKAFSRKGSFTDRLQQCDSAETAAQEASDHNKSDIKSARARKMTEDESSRSRESEPNSYNAATKNTKAPNLLLQSPGRRHSESRISFFPKDNELQKKQEFRKRNGVFNIDPKALEQILISIDYNEDPHKSSKGEYSSQSAQVHSPESSASITPSSSSVCESEDEDSANDDSPFSKKQKNVMPQYLKSRFFNLNKSKTANMEKEEENLMRRSDRFITYQGVQNRLSSEETKEMKDSSDEGVPPVNFTLKDNRKKSSFFRTEDVSPTLSAESRMDPRLIEKIRKVRQEISQIKTIISLYEVIRDKGKGIINQPPYLKSII